MRLNQPSSAAGRGEHATRRCWRAAVPAVCLLAGILLGTTHSVSAGREIRTGEAPRLVDLAGEARQAVERLAAQRDALVGQIGATHGASPGPALAAIESRAARLAAEAGSDPVRGPGLVVTLTDAGRDADGRFPRDATPDDLVVHQQDVQAVLNALWAGGAEAIALQDQRIIATSAPRCVGNTLLLNGRTSSPPYTITAVGDPAALSAALADSAQVRLYRQYVVRFGLGYTEQAGTDLTVPGFAGPVRMRYARPAGPLVY